MRDMRVRLSMLWVFALFNYLYADVITLFDLVLVQKPAAAAARVRRSAEARDGLTGLAL